jgi:hypothetical protein
METPHPDLPHRLASWDNLLIPNFHTTYLLTKSSSLTFATVSTTAPQNGQTSSMYECYTLSIKMWLICVSFQQESTYIYKCWSVGTMNSANYIFGHGKVSSSKSLSLISFHTLVPNSVRKYVLHILWHQNVYTQPNTWSSAITITVCFI